MQTGLQAVWGAFIGSFTLRTCFIASAFCSGAHLRSLRGIPKKISPFPSVTRRERARRVNKTAQCAVFSQSACRSYASSGLIASKARNGGFANAEFGMRNAESFAPQDTITHAKSHCGPLELKKIFGALRREACPSRLRSRSFTGASLLHASRSARSFTLIFLSFSFP